MTAARRVRAWAAWASLPGWLVLGERFALRAGGAPDDSLSGRASLLLLAAAAGGRAGRHPSAWPLALVAVSALLRTVAVGGPAHGSARGWAAWGACALVVAAWPASVSGRAHVALSATTAALWTVAVAGTGGLRVAPTFLAWTGAAAGVAGGLAWAIASDEERETAARETPPWPLQAGGALVSGSTVVLCAWLDAPLHVPALVLGWGFLARAWAGRHPHGERRPLALTTGALVLVAAAWALA
jgi:hypothetical protein